jgi:adenylate cyclase
MDDDQVVFEKERKFLPNGDEGWREAAKSAEKCPFITQGYLLIDPARGISRVRINCNSDGQFLDARLEVKLHPTDQGAPELPPAKLDEKAAMQCLELATGGTVQKFRHYIRHGDLLFHVDQFIGRHAPLVIIELEHEDPASIKRDMLPPWVGDEVTGDRQYNNVAIAQR